MEICVIEILGQIPRRLVDGIVFFAVVSDLPPSLSLAIYLFFSFRFFVSETLLSSSWEIACDSISQLALYISNTVVQVMILSIESRQVISGENLLLPASRDLPVMPSLILISFLLSRFCFVLLFSLIISTLQNASYCEIQAI